MAYASIDNLYKNQEILLFKECFALEKIHGSSAHIKFTNVSAPNLHFFSGGESHERFTKIFNQENLIAKFVKLGQIETIIFGEAYGGKCQGMSETYGKELKFVAFDVKIGDKWLDIPKAELIVKQLGLEFVDYVKIPTTIEAIDFERDKPSTQAKRNGILEDKIREGVVLRPIIELTKNNGERICAKHKRDEFRETKTPRPVVDPAQLEVLSKASLVAEEWVTNERLFAHIVPKIPDCSIDKMGEIIKNMVDDIKREGAGEIVWSKDVEKAISRKTAQMYKDSLKNSLK